MIKSYYNYINEMAIPYSKRDNDANVFKAMYNNDADKLKDLSTSVNLETIRNSHIMTPLEYAALSGKLEMVKELINLGVDVNSSAPLPHAYYRKRLDVVDYLISIGADKNKLPEHGQLSNEPAIKAALDVGLLEHALKNGFSPDIMYKGEKKFNSVPFIFVLRNVKDIINVIKYGADLRIKSIK